jgi:FkbH-like protein
VSGFATNSSELTKIVIAGTFTVEPLSQPIEFWMERLRIPARIEFAPHNQIFQQLLDPSSVLCSNRGGVNIIVLRFEDWQPHDRGLKIERAVSDFLQALEQARQWTSSSFLICTCPEPQPSVLVRDLHSVISSRLGALSGIYLISSEELLRTYPVAAVHDSRSDKLAYIPYSPLFFTALGTVIARKIHALLAPPHKVIVLDCDQTLWSGVCGEDGPLGVRVTPEYAVLQDFMVKQHRAGMILCLCSKNNHEDVAAVFQAHPDMPLQRSHIVSERINWLSKSQNLNALSADLGLSLDAFVFIDDDPVECAEVSANCPEVLTLQLPSAAIPDFINHVWAFDRIALTEEDRERTAFYQHTTQREQLERESPTFAGFLEELKLHVEVLPVSTMQVARASQLTYRTNQFNFTGVRRPEAEMRDMVGSHRMECVGVHVNDRFGDYGLVGLIMFRSEGDTLNVENFLLSCRAMGKGVEHRMLVWLGRIALDRGVENVNLRFVTTSNNSPARLFLDSLKIGLIENVDGTLRMRIPAELAAQCRFDPDAVDHLREQIRSRRPEKPGVAQSSARTHRAPFSLIATQLNSVEKIHTAIVEQSRAPGTRSEVSARPETPLEKEVAAVWSEFLGIDNLRKDENFFTAGGHSLLAMQVLSQLCQTFDVELSPSVIFGEFTIESLSQAILSDQLRRSDPDEIELILQKVDALSEDEAKALLEGSEEEP